MSKQLSVLNAIRWKRIGIICMILLLGSCTNNNIPTESTEAMVAQLARQSSDNEAITWFFNIQQAIVEFFDTSSADLILISDPFYAASFVGASTSSYEKFYNTAYARGFTAHIMIGAESNIPGQSKHNIDVGTFFDAVPLLSAMDWLRIKYADRIVVSPLLSVFAPIQYKTIQEIRKASKKSIEYISYSSQIFDEHIISIDYSKGMFRLGQLAAEKALEYNAQNPQIAMILDSLQEEEIAWRTQYFLDGVADIDSTIAVVQHWSKKTGETINSSVVIMNELSEDTIIIVDAGVHSYAIAEDFFARYNQYEYTSQNRLMMVYYIPPEQLQYKYPIFATVELPIDFLFHNTHVIESVVRVLDRD